MDVNLTINIIIGGKSMDLDWTNFEAAMTRVQSSLTSEQTREAANATADQATIDAATTHLGTIADALDAADPTTSNTGPSSTAGSSTSGGATAPAPTTDPTSTSTSDPTSTTEPTGTAPTGTTGTTAVAELPLYEYVGSAPIDESVWAVATVETTDQPPVALYTFSGDTAGAAPTGASADWVVYTGTTQPVLAAS